MKRFNLMGSFLFPLPQTLACMLNYKTTDPEFNKLIYFNINNYKIIYDES